MHTETSNAEATKHQSQATTSEPHPSHMEEPSEVKTKHTLMEKVKELLYWLAKESVMAESGVGEMKHKYCFTSMFAATVCNIYSCSTKRLFHRLPSWIRCHWRVDKRLCLQQGPDLLLEESWVEASYPCTVFARRNGKMPASD